MKVYTVGGAVRDALLGLPVKDRDYVVVGASPQQMLDAGYKQVGADFPVFLHPQTHEEYALARTERKIGRGYKGFAFHAAPDVTLEEDLQRRDLTINAMAQDANGSLIDPYGGARDLQAGMLRHVSNAFKEDPVRILRVARFAARFSFRVADETMQLMRAMVQSGEVDALVPERVWQELSRGLSETVPSRLFAVLRQCGALAKIMPEVNRLFDMVQPGDVSEAGQRTMQALDYAAAQKQPLPVRFAVLAHDLGQDEGKNKRSPPALQAVRSYQPRQSNQANPAETANIELAESLCQRLRVPGECRDLALLAARWHDIVHEALHAPPQTLLALFEGADTLRRPARFANLIDVCACIDLSRTNGEMADYPSRDYLQAALKALQSLDMQALAAAAPANISSYLRAAKLATLERFVQDHRRERKPL